MDILVMQIGIKPSAMYAFSGLLYFASFLDVFTFDENTGVRRFICDMPVKKDYETYISALYIINDNEFLIAIHSYDINYEPTETNGLYHVKFDNIAIAEKVFPLNDKQEVYILNSITKNRDLYYITDGVGNLYWLECNNLFNNGIVMGIGKHMAPNYYYGFESSFVNNIQKYDQSGHGIGLTSCACSDNIIICSNYGLGILIVANLTDNGKSVKPEIQLKMKKTGFYFYSRVKIYNDRLFVASPITKNRGETKKGKIIYEVINNKLVAVTDENKYINCVTDFIIKDHRAILLSSDEKTASIISVPLI